MSITTDPYLRELDHRYNDGIDVRLLWNPATNRVTVSVQDERLGESFVLDADGADALDAFHHPYAYTRRGGLAHELAAYRGTTEQGDNARAAPRVWPDTRPPTEFAATVRCTLGGLSRCSVHAGPRAQAASESHRRKSRPRARRVASSAI